MTGALHEAQYTILIIYRSVVLRMRNIRDRSFRENQNIHFTCNKLFFFENHAVYEVMWKNTVQPDTWKINMTNTLYTLNTEGYKHAHSQYVILTSFALQQWLQESCLNVTSYVHSLQFLYSLGRKNKTSKSAGGS